MRRVTLLRLLKKHYPTVPEKELFASVMCGEVWRNGERTRDPRSACCEDDVIEIKKDTSFVSRGGNKLDGALNAFGVDCRGRTFIDCGASTGGFTDCLLRRGAALVYAVDVGFAQFDYRLRHDPRVVLMERTNIMCLTQADFHTPPAAAVIDLSFRSLRKAAAHIIGLTAEQWAIALVKPQFEWRNPPRGYKGIVRDAEKRREILFRLADDLNAEKIRIVQATVSPITGAKGNIEYFFLLTFSEGETKAEGKSVIATVFEDEGGTNRHDRQNERRERGEPI